MGNRVLWLSDGGANTGFGRVTHGIGDRLVRDYGWDIHCLAVNYDGDYWPTPIKLYLPNKKRREDVYGISRYVEVLAEVMPDVVVFVNDPYVILKHLFRNTWDENLLTARFRPILAYMPVDGVNFPVNWGNMPNLIGKLPATEGGPRPELRPVVMSEHGWNLFPGAPLVYHGVDTDLFYPVSQARPITMSNGTIVRSKADAKRAIGMDPDDFLVLRVDRNSHRKNFADTWRALQPLMKRYSDIKVWFHCKAEGDSLEIPQIISREISTGERFYYPGSFTTNNGWSNQDIAAIYNAADVFVSTSWGEGFGLTLAEAAATGIPVVAQNVSSIPEVVGPGAILLEPERLIAVDSGEDQWLPNVDAFTDAIDRLYNSRRMRRELGEAGRQHVAKFSWDTAAMQFDELLKTMVQENPVPSIGERDAAKDPVHA